MIIRRSFAALLAAAFLAGCNTIEHRSEEVPLEPLPAISQRNLTPKMVWATRLTQGDKNDVKLRLALAGNALVSADGSGNLYSQDPNNGKVQWHIKDTAAFSAGPTLVEDTILLGTREGNLRAYAANNGQFKWETRLTGEILAAPKGYQNTAFVKTQDGSIYAVKLDDGKILWRYALHVPHLVLRHCSSPIITPQHVFVGFANGRLVAIHRNSGIVDWERTIASPKGRSDFQRMADISADPLVVNNIVYVVSYQGHLAALSEEDGQTLWEKEFSSFSGLDIQGSKLFLADAKGHVHALNAKTGETIWEQTKLQGRQLSKPTIFGDKITVGDNEGNLHYLSLETGNYLTRVFVDAKGIQAPPLVMGDKLYILGRGGNIAVLKPGA